jgi:nucleotide-binding universal stress UspA family protein
MAARTRRIMVGYDGTEAGRRALDAAADLIGYGSTLAVVTSRNGELAEDARRRLLGRQVSASYVQRPGDAGESLVQSARELRAELIVVGDDEALRATMVAHALCDVLLVR